jgi:hypothetical protein
MTIIGEGKFMYAPFQPGTDEGTRFGRIAYWMFIDEEEIAMRHFIVILAIVIAVLPAVFGGADYLYLDKKGKIKERASDDGDRIRFCDKSNNPNGWYDRDTSTKFDKIRTIPFRHDL